MKHRVAAWESMPWEAVEAVAGAERGERTGDMCGFVWADAAPSGQMHVASFTPIFRVRHFSPRDRSVHRPRPRGGL